MTTTQMFVLGGCIVAAGLFAGIAAGVILAHALNQYSHLLEKKLNRDDAMFNRLEAVEEHVGINTDQQAPRDSAPAGHISVVAGQIVPETPVWGDPDSSQAWPAQPQFPASEVVARPPDPSTPEGLAELLVGALLNNGGTRFHEIHSPSQGGGRGVSWYEWALGEVRTRHKVHISERLAGDAWAVLVRARPDLTN